MPYLKALNARLAPPLFRTHPGYAIVLLALVWTHLGFGLDYVDAFGGHRHTAGVFIGLQQAAPMWVWGIAHLSSAVLIMAGLYTRFALARTAAHLSTVVFSLLSLVGLWAAVRYDYASFGAFFINSTMAAISARATVEPVAILSVRHLKVEV